MIQDEFDNVLKNAKSEVLKWPKYLRSDDVIKEFPKLYEAEVNEMYSESSDGIDHINIHLKAKTDLGKFLWQITYGWFFAQGETKNSSPIKDEAREKAIKDIISKLENNSRFYSEFIKSKLPFTKYSIAWSGGEWILEALEEHRFMRHALSANFFEYHTKEEYAILNKKYGII